MLTIEEAVKMQGVEFTYFFPDGDSVPAYVKKFEPETGRLTCYSLDSKTKEGWVPEPDKDTLPDGTFCVYGYDDLEVVLKDLTEIAKTGKYKVEDGNSFSIFAGCSFN